MRFILILFTFVLGIQALVSQNIDESYISAWKQFYPTKAVSQGIHSAIHYPDLRLQADIDHWIELNERYLTMLSKAEEKETKSFVKERPIDARLLRAQIRKELDNWREDENYKFSLKHYSELIMKGLQTVLNADYLVSNEKKSIFCKKQKSIVLLCQAAKNNLIHVDQNNLERASSELEKVIQILKDVQTEYKCEENSTTVQAIRNLISYADEKLKPKATASSEILGRDAYAQELELYTDSKLTPEQLEKIALEEIHKVRGIIANKSVEYLNQKYPDGKQSEDLLESISLAFADMEKDAPVSGEDYKSFWFELSERAQQFIEENKIATLPGYNTLRIENAPESAGPAARIGWVASAAPFDPNPVTTLYLPSIPDTLSAQEQKDFWSSFNKPFNRMIAIHELFPGHYMQIKKSRETANTLRLLFPNPVYFEGWATFTEKVLLDAGWDIDKPLTYLAHLRKRLENANRAYTSVQVHCNGWTQEQVMQFSTETSLLAPQFAKSLWGRIMRSPMQLNTYFLGGQQFKDVMAKVKKAQGDDFNLKDFMDTIMKAGPIPIDEFETIFLN